MSCITVCFTYSLRIAIFLNTDISQGSVTTRLECGGVYVYDFITNFLRSLTVKEFWKSVNIWWSYGQELGVLFFLFFDSQCRFGERGFSYRGPAAWNTLPSDLHDITYTGTFTKQLKNVVFDRVYHWLLLALLDVSYSGALPISRWFIDWSILRPIHHSHHP